MHKMMMTIAAVLLSAGLAQAQELPRYDVEQRCRDTTASVGGGEWLLQGCFDQEQRAYDSLKARWLEIAPTIRGHCEKTVASVGAAYWLLEGCIEQEEQAAADNAGRTFRY